MHVLYFQYAFVKHWYVSTWLHKHKACRQWRLSCNTLRSGKQGGYVAKGGVFGWLPCLCTAMILPAAAYSAVGRSVTWCAVQPPITVLFFPPSFCGCGFWCPA